MPSAQIGKAPTRNISTKYFLIQSTPFRKDLWQTVFALEFTLRLLPGPMISTAELSQYIDALYAMLLEPEMGRLPFKRRRSLTKTFGCGVAKSTLDCGVGA
jgi:hypothetical protein